MSKTKSKNSTADRVLELEALQMELEDVQFEIDSLRDKERYLKAEIQKLEDKE